jgi:hypothetical protein
MYDTSLKFEVQCKLDTIQVAMEPNTGNGDILYRPCIVAALTSGALGVCSAAPSPVWQEVHEQFSSRAMLYRGLQKENIAHPLSPCSYKSPILLRILPFRRRAYFGSLRVRNDPDWSPSI